MLARGLDLTDAESLAPSNLPSILKARAHPYLNVRQGVCFPGELTLRTGS